MPGLLQAGDRGAEIRAATPRLAGIHDQALRRIERQPDQLASVPNPPAAYTGAEDWALSTHLLPPWP